MKFTRHRPFPPNTPYKLISLLVSSKLRSQGWARATPNHHCCFPSACILNARPCVTVSSLQRETLCQTNDSALKEAATISTKSLSRGSGQCMSICHYCLTHCPRKPHPTRAAPMRIIRVFFDPFLPALFTLP